jgi:SAM-dependent methyltransferase
MGESTPILQLSEFLRSPTGRYVLDWEQAQLNAAVVDIFGYHALQLGLPELDTLRENRMPLRFCAAMRRYTLPAEDGGHERVAIINRYEELPFATHSIDLVVMPHILEFAVDPHQVLREVERVLVPEGRVVITGFNPASLWGLRQSGTRLGVSPFLPREGRFISLPRIKDWLKLLSFDVERGRFGCYAPPVRQAKWLTRWRFMERAGDRWWPVLGAVYLMTAVKRVRGMRLIGAVWKRKEEPARRLAPAASTINMFITGEAASAVVVSDVPAANEGAREAARG